VPIRKYVITLTDAELALCNIEAQERVQHAINTNAAHRETKTVAKDDPNNFYGHYRGCVSERAVEKYFGISHQSNTYDKTKFDLSNGCEVRSLQAKYSWGCMIVHKWDKPAPYVLCSLTEIANEFIVAGWRDLADCQLDKYWRADMPAPAYFVPQTDLHDMATLKQRFAA